MKKLFLTILFCLLVSQVQAQYTAGFENFGPNQSFQIFNDSANFENIAGILTASDTSVQQALESLSASALSITVLKDIVTVDVPVVLTMFDAVPSRASVSNWNGGLLLLDSGSAVSNGSPFVMTTKGSGKIILVINAGVDMVGDITATGTSVDRNTKAQTGSDTSVMTLTGVTTDSTTTDANGNSIPVFVKAYITDKWYTGVVTLSTTDTDISDMDIYHVSFEQFNDQPTIILDTFDANIFTTNVNAEFDAYLHTVHVTGDEVNVDNEADLHVGAVGGAEAQTAQANKYFRLRQGNIAEALDGTTDGFWVNVYYANSPVYVEDVTLKVWATCTRPIILN